jgi:hypothetical protein
VRACIGDADVDARVGDVIRADVGHGEIELDVGAKIDVRIGYRSVGPIRSVVHVRAGI